MKEETQDEAESSTPVAHLHIIHKKREKKKGFLFRSLWLEWRGISSGQIRNKSDLNIIIFFYYYFLRRNI